MGLGEAGVKVSPTASQGYRPKLNEVLDVFSVMNDAAINVIQTQKDLIEKSKAAYGTANRLPALFSIGSYSSQALRPLSLQEVSNETNQPRLSRLDRLVSPLSCAFESFSQSIGPKRIVPDCPPPFALASPKPVDETCGNDGDASPM